MSEFVPFSIHDEDAIKAVLAEMGEKPFRYGQIENAVYKYFETDFSNITTIPKKLHDAFAGRTFDFSLTLDHEIVSDNGQTTKFLFRTHDGEFIESVIMRHLSGRNTLCVSSQAGCPMACTFCATGKLGLKRNLEFYEIVEQAFYAARYLKKEDRSLRNVVFMGMGEPFLNYENVKKAIGILCAQKKFDLSNRRITVSTCGIVPKIPMFAADFPQTSLAISLHAPNDHLRKSIMPVDHRFPLDDLMNALDDYVVKTNKRVFYEYIMIQGVTDKPELAHELAKLLKGKLAHVNFIPYNAGEGNDENQYQGTPRVLIERFQAVLEKAGVPSTVRHTMGDDIDAACGQLALQR